LFDESILNLSMVDFAFAWHFYLELEFYRKVWWGMDENEMKLKRDKWPLEVKTLIDNKEYQPFIREYVLAKNVSHWLWSRGINSAVDSIFFSFQPEYPSSEYTSTLKETYNKFSAILPGNKAPEFIGLNPSGEQIKLSDFKGKVVYVDVWSTSCGPCIKEFPHSINSKKQFEKDDDVVFLYVSVDRNSEKWKKFISGPKAPVGIHLNDFTNDRIKSIRESYMIWGIPRYILIGKDGKLIDPDAPRPSSEEIADETRKLI
ncbi:MAG: TlpA family protein disulfide reductase, partial [Cyclobacteriaceae bacterium]|nr:TlpA family protein disulfide reductase [Cyclobacteriaceae bacterium]